jgi:hypothetical protein
VPIVPSAQGPRVALAGGGLPALSPPDLSIPEQRLSAGTVGTPQVSTPQYRTPQLEARLQRGLDINAEALQPARIRQEPYAYNNQQQDYIDGSVRVLAGMYQRYQAKVNATVVDDALNDALEAARRSEWGSQDQKTGQMVGGYRNAKGYDAIRRQSGKALPDEAAEEFDKAVREIAKNKLANGDQRRAFDAQVGRLRERLTQGATQHQAQQYEVYYRETYKARLDNLTNSAATLYGDQPALKETLGEIEGTVAMLAQQQGASAEEQQEIERKARSAALAGAVRQAMADKKTMAATALLNEYAPGMSTDVVRGLRQELEGKVSIETGETVGAAIYKGMVEPTANGGSDSARILSITADSESRNRDYGPDGKVLTSTAGAKGRMQVLDSTNLDPGYGVKPARDDSVEERARVGRDYMLALTRHYGGDLKKAWAAYNWGPGNLDKAMREHGGDWFAHAPKETRDYVDKNMAAYGSGKGAPKEMSRSQMYDQVERLLPGADNVDARKAAIAYIDKRWSTDKAEQQEADNQAYADAIGIIDATGGNINAIPPSMKSKLGDKWPTIETYAKQKAEGAYRVSKPEAYYFATQPTNLRGLNLNQVNKLKTDLSEEDFRVVYKMWLDANAPAGAGKGPDSLNVQMLDGIVDNRLTYLGVNIKPKDDNERARLGAIRQFVHQYVLDRQRQSGAKVEEFGDMNDLVNQMFARDQKFRTSVLGLKTGEGSQNVLTTRITDLPKDTRARIETRLRKQFGGRKPTEAQVLQDYFSEQFYGPTTAGQGARVTPAPGINWGR